MGETQPNPIKHHSVGHYDGLESDALINVGAVTPRDNISEVLHLSDDNHEVRISGFEADPDDTESVFATRYLRNLDTHDVEVEHGRIRGAIREAGHYAWEHRKPIIGAAALALTVTVGTLKVRHKNK